MIHDYKSMITRALRYSTAEYCEIRLEETQITSIAFQGPRLDRVTDMVSYGGNVRALKNGGWGFASFNDLDNLEKKVQEACSQAALLGDRLKKKIRLYPASPVEDHVAGNFKKEVFSVPLKDKVEVLDAYNRFMLNGQDIVSTNAVYADCHTHSYYGNTEGTLIYQEKMDMQGALIPIASKGGLTVQDGLTFGSGDDFDVFLSQQEKLLEATNATREMLKAPVIEAGEYTVILSPEMAGLFVHEAFGHLSEADSLDEDERMKDLLRIGRKYGGENLDIFDTGLMEGNRGWYKYDDEGTLAEKTYLIKKGEVVGHLHSRESAWKMGEKPTGNARAISYRHPPIVRMRTTCIGPGSDALEDMFKDVGLGVYVGGGYGGETNLEMFTFAASRCKMIRNGALAEAVRDVNLTGNVFRTLNSIDMIGNDFTITNTAGGCGKAGQSPLPTASASPHIRIQNVVIGGEEKI